MSDENEQDTCIATRDNGEPCTSPFTNSEGLCPAHREGGREELRERGSRGGHATANRHREGPDTIEEEALGELESFADAKRRLDLVCRSVLSGQITRERADPAIRALREWCSAHQSEVEEEKLEELEHRLEQIENGGGSTDSWGPGA